MTALPYRIVNSHAGPYFNGVGDAILLSWVAEGSKGTPDEIRIHANGSKLQLLEILGQGHIACSDQALNPSEIYTSEQMDEGQIGRALRASQMLNVHFKPRRPVVTIPASARDYADNFWGPRLTRHRILFCPESNDNSRRYRAWDKLFELLSSDDVQIMSMTAHNCGSNWRNAAAIIDVADVVVAVDSAHGHLAGTLNRPTVVLCGPTRSTAFEHMPNVLSLSVTSQQTPCVGCSYGQKFRSDDCWPNGCVALQKLRPEEVAQRVRERMVANSMMYRTYSQLAEDVRQWCRTLPPFSAVAGIPRAGVIVAAMIAAERNIHLVTLDDLKAGRKPWESPLRRSCPAKPNGDVLVVDDTVATGGHMRAIKEQLLEPWCKFGAVYGMDSGLSEVDFVCHRVGSIDHVFEWNWQHHWFVENSLFDLDGVLCEDWPHLSETGHLEVAYQHHLLNARCYMVPSFPIGEIVTARLEKFRPQTEAWLNRNGIRFKSLTMAPYATPEERAANRGFAERKAEIYLQRPWARMFVESNHSQAEVIARLTGRPVLSWETQVMLNGAK